MEASPLQIIKAGTNNTITLDQETLHQILTRDEIKDRYVSVISITGVFRQGKSFLLNFLLRYLRIKYIEMKNVTHWLRPEDGPLKGFVWAPGSKRHTTGIVMWSEIFLTEIPTGEKVAIILLDTQGAFDNQTTMGDCAKIFSLSTLISSVQIYNVIRNIKQYDLTYLQCFGNYGSLLSNFGESPFQNLYFLVRDWPCPYEHSYGQTGGMELLEEVMQSDKPEIQEQFENVRSLFNKISCFLLPYPGRDVDTSETFDGDINEIDADFKLYVQEFVSQLLAPENIVVKTVGGKKVTAECLMYFVQEYCSVLKEGALPPVETIFRATVEAHHKTASCQGFRLYKKNMDADVKYHPRCLSEEDLYQKHAANKVKAINYYSKIKKFENEDVYDRYLVALKESMDAEYRRYRTLNDEKQKKYDDSRRRMEERIRQTTIEPSTSGLSTLSTGEKVGLAAGFIGGAVALAFGASKLFSNSRGKNE